MSIAIAKKGANEAEKTEIQIPDYLIYEVVRGRPIYYKGYRDVLNKTKTIEEIKMESKLQSWLKAQITGILFALLQQSPFEVLTGELGLNLPEKTKRGADIAIFKSENLILNEFFSDAPPEIIIEIDVTADTEKQTEMDYVNEKIEDYLSFGVQKVIWIFSRTKKIIIADETLPWLIYNWDKDIEIMKDVSFNLNKMLEGKKMS